MFLSQKISQLAVIDSIQLTRSPRLVQLLSRSYNGLQLLLWLVCRYPLLILEVERREYCTEWGHPLLTLEVKRSDCCTKSESYKDRVMCGQQKQYILCNRLD